MGSFIDKTPMQITNVNPRKQGSGEDGGVAASDLSVLFQVRRDFMDQLIPQQDKRFSDIFYGEDGALRETRITPLKYHGEIESLRVTVHNGRRPLVFEEARMKNITMEPTSGGYIDVTALIQVLPASEVESGKLDFLCKNVVGIEVETMIDHGDVEDAGADATNSE